MRAISFLAWQEAGGRRTAHYTNVPPGRYTFRVTGRMSERARDAFATMDVVEVPAETVITGPVDEQQVHEILALIQDLGLHVVSVQRVTP